MANLEQVALARTAHPQYDTDNAPSTPADLSAEQAYLDRAYACLDRMQARTAEAVADAADRAPGDWDATVAHAHLTRRLKSLDADFGPLCFGRIDEEGGPAWHIGRRHVEAPSGDPAVVDWRAPVAIPFYRATFRDPLGLDRRRRFILEGRHLVDILDEDFDDPESADRATGAGLPDPLLAELGRARTGAMRDIVATIAGEQDAIIRAPLHVPVLVQGGPGTGKTAVGLHRTAFLLYEHRALLERQGVLVLGPNRIFLTYISQVLPSLGEVAVVQTTLPGLVGQWRPKGAESREIAGLKGDPRLMEVIARACSFAISAPKEPLSVSTRWGNVHIASEELGELLDAALESGGALGQRRTRFRRAVARRVSQLLAGARRDMTVDSDAVQADLRSDGAAQRALDRIWPPQSAASVIRTLLGRTAVMESSAYGVLHDDEQQALRRPPARTVASQPWTAADLPLLDEADAYLTGPPVQYGHVVVDEAQDLSPMALRMVARRLADGRSVTVLGDLAQATTPGALTTWATAIEALGSPEGATLNELSTGYRVPRPIMDLANTVLAAMPADLPMTTSVRLGGDVPSHISADPDDLVEQVAGEATRLAQTYMSVVVISVDRHDDMERAIRSRGLTLAPPGVASETPHASLLGPEEAKGLEFDAVVVVEPSQILAHPAGRGLLYIALTRAVQHVTVVHTGDLPTELRPPDEAPAVIPSPAIAR